jgi:hypothetical protein
MVGPFRDARCVARRGISQSSPPARRNAALTSRHPLWGLELGRLNFAGLLGVPRFLRRLYNRLRRSGDFVFKCANRLPQQDDRSLPEILARFVSLRIVSCWSTNWTQSGAVKRGICDEGVGVESETS